MKYALILLLVFFAMGVQAESLDGTFQPPTQREDGSALQPSEIAEYIVEVRGAANEAFTIPGDATTFSYTATAPGTYTFRMQTVDTDGERSAFSNEVVATILGNPNAPVILEITVTQ